MKDPALCEVVEFFLGRSGFEHQAALTLRRALDEVIDGMRTGRWSVDALEKTEKTYIGTKVEILFRFEFELDQGKALDTRIRGHEVDIKCTVLKDWMIPREALEKLCLLVQVDDARSRFSLGVVRATASILRPAQNRDQKHSVSAEGKKAIRWLVKDGALPQNLLAGLDKSVRKRIMSQSSGQLRINELLRSVQGKIIPRVAIETVARQKDPMKRVRDARKILRGEGILVLGHQGADPKIAQARGYSPPRKGEVLTLPASIEPLD
jgi:hypothetical protein